jgi:hypothetical protein
MIDEDEFDKFKLILLPDRKKDTLKNISIENVLEGTVIKTDGHPSYPEAILGSDCIHKVVNHSEGFKNCDGDHTNFIENLKLL